MRGGSPASDRQPSNAMVSVFDADDGACLECFGTRCDDVGQACDHVIGTSVAKPEHDGARLRRRDGHDFGEVEIERQNDATLGRSFGEDGVVGESMKALLAKVHRFVPVLTKPESDAGADAHVDEKAQQLLGRMDFFRRQPGCVFEGLPHVLLLEIGVVREDVGRASPMSNRTDDDRYRNAHATDARATAQDLRLERDAVEHRGAVDYSSAQHPSAQLERPVKLNQSVPRGIRTPVSDVKSRGPGPLDDGD